MRGSRSRSVWRGIDHQCCKLCILSSAGASRGCVVGESQCWSLNNDEAMNVFIKELISLHRGQVMEREDSKE